MSPGPVAPPKAKIEPCRHCGRGITREGHVAGWWWHPHSGVVWCSAKDGPKGTEAVPFGEPCEGWRPGTPTVCRNCGLHPRFHTVERDAIVEHAVLTLRLYAPHLLAENAPSGAYCPAGQYLPSDTGGCCACGQPRSAHAASQR